MVNFKELLGNNNQLQNLLLDTVDEGEIYCDFLGGLKIKAYFCGKLYKLNNRR